MKHYTFNYDMFEAEACFKVDTEKFTIDIAKKTLEFFTWDYDKDGDPIDEVMKKYAMAAIIIATIEGYNLYGVIQEFMNKEGFCKVDGSMGIELDFIQQYEFDENKLSMEVVQE